MGIPILIGNKLISSANLKNIETRIQYFNYDYGEAFYRTHPIIDHITIGLTFYRYEYMEEAYKYLNTIYLNNEKIDITVFDYDGNLHHKYKDIVIYGVSLGISVINCPEIMMECHVHEEINKDAFFYTKDTKQ